MAVALAMIYFVEAMPLNTVTDQLTSAMFRAALAVSFGAIVKKTKLTASSTAWLCFAIALSSLAGTSVHSHHDIVEMTMLGTASGMVLYASTTGILVA